MSVDLSDPAQYQRAFEEHHGSVFTAAFRVLGNAAQAQDVVQDVFLRLWRRPQAYDARRGDLGAYLRVMGRSRAVDVWREGQAAGRAGDRLKLAVAQQEARPDERPADAVERDAARRAVREELRRLPAPQREALVLAYWGGLTSEEIARRSDVPLGTAKSRIRLGMGRLRSNLPAELEAA